MKNPWTQLGKSSPFVLHDDWEVMRRTRKMKGQQRNRKEFKVLPFPFSGSRNRSRILALLLNPGFANDGLSDISMHQLVPSYSAENRKALLFKKTAVPFFILNERYACFVGFDWWYKNWMPVIKQVGLKAVQHHLMCVEFIPYHSSHFSSFDINTCIPSQRFSVFLVREAMKKGKTIIIMKGKPRWFKEIPALKTYRRLICLNTTRKSIISPKNVGRTQFERICRILAHP